MAANNFDPSLAFTLKYEGGYVDDPRDPGGATNLGITFATLRAWRSKTITKADVKALTRSEASAIYRQNYWQPSGCESIAIGPDLATFDLSVNSGVSRGKSYYAAARQASSNPVAQVKAICAKRLGFLHALSTWQTFGKGWGARVAACEALGVRMALAAVNAPAVAQTLTKESATASKTAKAQSNTAVAATVAGGAPAAVTIPAAPSNLWLWIGLGVLVVSIAILIIKSRNNQARAEAYAGEAQGA